MNILDKIKERRIYQHETEEEEGEENIEDTSQQQEENEIDHTASVQEYNTTEHTETITEKSNKPEALQEMYKKEQKMSETDEENIPIDESLYATPDAIDIKKLSRNISAEIEVMTTYALNEGEEIPETTSNLIVSKNIEDLIKVHNDLSKIVSPANPETIAYVKNYNNSRKKIYLFSSIPLVRNFILIAIIVIISLLLSGLSEEVNKETLSKGILDNHGISLLKNLIFLCSGAGIGTVFFLLSKLTKEVKNATLSKDDTTYYWAMLIMGMLSGLILSEMIVLNQSNLKGQSIEINRLLFALLGGFSSEVVYGVLETIMDKIRALIGGK